MSDQTTATPTAAPDMGAFVPQEAPQAPAQPAAPRLSFAEAKAALRASVAAPVAPEQTSAQQAPVEPTPDATGRLHGDDGRFVEKPEGQTDGAPSAETTAESKEGPEAGGDTADTDAAGGAPPKGFVKIELPADHPLREQGHDYVLAPEGKEDLYRNLANSAVRRREVEAVNTQLREREEELIRTAAALRASQEFTSNLFADRRITDTYWQLREDQGPDAANYWLQGLVSEAGQNVGQYIEQAQAQAAEARYTAQANAFLQADVPQARRLYPHWNDQEFQTSLASYASYAAATGAELSVASFKEHADAIYARHPKVQEAIAEYRARERQQQENAIREQGAAREREALSRTREIVDSHPLAALPAAAHTGHQDAPPAVRLNYRDARRAATGR